MKQPLETWVLAGVLDPTSELRSPTGNAQRLGGAPICLNTGNRLTSKPRRDKPPALAPPLLARASTRPRV